MIKDSVLSSEQALDEYFTSLLDEEGLLSSAEAEALDAKTRVTEDTLAESDNPSDSVIVDKPDLDIAGDVVSEDDIPLSEPAEYSVESPSIAESPEELESEQESFNLDPQPEVQPEPIPSYTETVYNEFEAPDLEDVQRLLSQLESTNIADEPEIDELIGQNTVEIATLSAEEPEVAVVDKTAVEEVATQLEPDEIQEWAVDEPEVAIAEPDIAIAEPEIVVSEPEINVDEPEITKVESAPEVQRPIVEDKVEEPEVEVATEVEAQTKTGGDAEDTWHTVARHEAFQVLYFDVNNVTFAVPLDELGGIHRKNEELNHLIGRPDWYLGLQTSRKEQLDVVDTARWVMSEKLVDDSHRENYEYIVMLGESHWGLAANQLMGTEWLEPEKVRWRESAGKRPWLAGMVKEKMCALIHVEELVSMLNAGLDVKALDS
ncbi:chemotaxis protein CheW [Vibrio penaeicida]|uniref:Chemotaxis protein CheW n=1 Tax=Vibrio penaeicida TaxID=104609 RepID=A0AAV5NXE3_9VIBR|nr:chemotaxis protein CheW [Vibrio penaeicida]RTZ21536.1 chemotaxis protein CheW [Vibrio penaeicida]GLQ75235.1 chemotaxis protein CheW [Vibrio penaeicida]